MGIGGSLLAEILKEHKRTESGAPRDAWHLDFISKATRGAPGWLSGLKPLPWVQGMIPGSWNLAPHQALCSAGSLIPPLSLSACLSVYM